MDRKKSPLSRKEPKAVLRKAGYKVTPARLAVIGLMERSKKPFSTQEMIERIGSGFNEATIYRTVRTLKSSCIIRQIDLLHNHAHYELAAPDDHHHLVCTVCGRIEDIAGCEVEEMYNAILRAAKGFAEIRQHTLEFFGICASCGKKQIQ